MGLLDKIDFIFNILDCKPSLLASLLGISTDTLYSWRIPNGKEDGRIVRIDRLYHIIKAFSICNIDSKLMIGLLNEPIFGEDTESWLDLIADY